MYRDVMSMVKISLSWPEKLKSRKTFSSCVLSLMYDGKDSTMSSVGQLQAETIARPGLLGCEF